MSLTALARAAIDERAGKASLGPIAESVCPTVYKQVRKLEKKASLEIDAYLSPDEHARLNDLLSEVRDNADKNCIQRVLELAEELDYLDDVLLNLKASHPVEYQALVNQRSSVIGDLDTARKLLRKLL